MVAAVGEILEEYRQYLPLTNRQLFYRLVASYGFPKTERDYRRLCEYMNRARRSGLIRFDHIRDDGISVWEEQHYSGEEDFYRHIRELGEAYRKDKLTDQHVEIRAYCEAEGMLPQVGRTLSRYSIPVYSCSGFDSLTAKHQLANWCSANWTYGGKRSIVLHLGDHDPSGVSIFESIRDDVWAFLKRRVPYRDPRSVAHFERVALTPLMVAAFDLPTAPAKESDSRSASWEGGTCQLEALRPDTLAEILVGEIEGDEWIPGFLNREQLARDREAEEQTRRRVVRQLMPGDEGGDAA